MTWRELAGAPESLALADRMAAKYARGRFKHEYEEFYSAGLVGLVEAARRFDPAKCTRGTFLDFAALLVGGRIVDHIRLTWGRAESTRLGHKRAEPLGAAVFDLIAAGPPVGAELESADVVLKLTARFDGPLRAALRAWATTPGAVLADVARECGVNAGRCTKALKELRGS